VYCSSWLSGTAFHVFVADLCCSCFFVRVARFSLLYTGKSEVRIAPEDHTTRSILMSEMLPIQYGARSWIKFLSLGVRGRSSAYNFESRDWCASDVQNYPVIRQTLQSHLQHENVMIRRFSEPFIGRAVSGELDLTSTSPVSTVMSNSSRTLKMTAAAFAETLGNFPHPTLPISESRSCSLGL
jgi:hypothetical protein